MIWNDDVVVEAVGWTVHLIFMLISWSILTAPIWVAIWLVVDWVYKRRRKAEGR